MEVEEACDMSISNDVWAVEGDGIRLKISSHLDLHKTFDCGQCFRWRFSEGAWRGVAGSHGITVLNDEAGWKLSPCSEEEFREFWYAYLDLDRDYETLEALYLGLDTRLDTALALGKGIRILRQPFWETVVSFILSANNNIPRIQGMIDRLCQAAGQPLGADTYGFPEPEAVAGLTEAELRALGFGYRAPFIVKLAQGFITEQWRYSDFLEGTTAEIRKKLLALPGVGPKVADCILLFGLGRLDAFPVDTWIRKTLDELDRDKPEDQKIMSCISDVKRCATIGYVQQVLFYSARYQKWGN